VAETQLRIRLVHMYGFTFYPETRVPQLTTETNLIHRQLQRDWNQYDLNVLLGGWLCCRKKGWFMPDRPTSADVVYRMLVDDGVPVERLVTQFHPPSLKCDHVQPARCTMEEADLGLHILHALTGRPPRYVPFEALCLGFHSRRVRMIWQSRRANCQKVVGVPILSWRLKLRLLPRMLQEPVGIWITKKDPLGNSDFFKKLRDDRTHNGADHYRKVVSPNDWPE